MTKVESGENIRGRVEVPAVRSAEKGIQSSADLTIFHSTATYLANHRAEVSSAPLLPRGRGKS